MERGLLLDVIVGQSPAILQLLASEDQALLIRGDADEREGERVRVLTGAITTRRADKESNLPLLVLDLCLDIVNGV